MLLLYIRNRKPPSALRDRAEDIPLLAEYFLKEAAAEVGSAVTGITDAAMNILAGFHWPGNIRQLRNCIRTMVVMCDAVLLDVQDIPPEIHQLRQLAAGIRIVGDLGGMSLNELQKQAITDTLAKTKGNRQKTAKSFKFPSFSLFLGPKSYLLIAV